MSKCPKCKEKIETLNFNGTATVFMRFSLSGGYPDYERENTEFRGDDDEYFCPICDEKLFNTEDKASKFLKK